MNTRKNQTAFLLLSFGYATLLFFRDTANKGVDLSYGFVFFYLLALSFLCSSGTFYIVGKVGFRLSNRTPFFRLAAILLVQSACLLAILVLHYFISKRIFPPVADKTYLITDLELGLAINIVFTLFCEWLNLNKLREEDSLVLISMENQLKEAEIEILKNELDPHFVYNTMMPLYCLIQIDTEKAKQFVHKLLQVYQYLLESKSKNYISLADELEFSRNYFFLLQVRYRDTVYMSVANKGQINLEEKLLLPFSLQVLLENAIKHNDFDVTLPLHVEVIIEENSVTMKNTYSPKASSSDSTGTGLKNLRARFRFLAKSSIFVTTTSEHFIVRIPLIDKTIAYDKNSDNRRRFFNF